jgi:hypothetical protein
MIVCPGFGFSGKHPMAWIVSKDLDVRRWATGVNELRASKCGPLNFLVGGPSADVIFIGRSGATTEVALSWQSEDVGLVTQRSVLKDSGGVPYLKDYCGPVTLVLSLQRERSRADHGFVPLDWAW